VRRSDLLRRDQPGGGDEDGGRVRLMLKGFIFDLDGTVYLGEKLLPGADQVIRLLRETGRKVVFLSNKPLQTRENYAEKLTRLGVPTTPTEVINSSFVMTRYLLKRAPGARLFVIGESPFIKELERAGFPMSDDPDRIEWVIAAFDRTFDYRKLNIAYQAIKRGAHFIATNPDRTCPVEGGEIPDCAGIIAAIEAVTQKRVEAVVGKPSPIIIEVALEVLGLRASECILIGDRIETDIRMGKESGMATGLVLTGVADEAALEASPLKPDYVFASIADLINGLGLH
jgi:HAD superfamily hydrolase (TIGR01457 family)